MATATLRHFDRPQLLFNQQESYDILRFFGIEPGIQAAALTDEDRSFAQALLVEAVDASYAMGYVNIIYDTFFLKPPTSPEKVKSLVKRFLEKVAEHWFEHATKDNLRDPKIYEYVRTTLQRNARTVWQDRQYNDGRLTY
jgi:hypothetical protein